MYRKERRGNCCRKNSFGNAGKIAISGFWKAVINLPKSNFTPIKKYDKIWYSDRRHSMIDTFKPFLIYWTVLILGCLFFFLCPFILFLLFPLLIIIIPTWAVIVYLIGSSIQQRSALKGIGKRIATSCLCSLLTILVLPTAFLLEDAISWGTISSPR